MNGCTSIILFFMLAATVVQAADPVVSNVRASQETGTKRVSIDYDVADADGDRLVVGVAVTINGGTIPARSFSGDTLVTPGKNRRIVWDAGMDWNNQFSRSVSFAVTARDISGGGYVVIDLSGGTNCENFAVSSLSSIPIGGWTEVYKTSKLVLRRIPAGSFLSGIGGFGVTTTLTSDFYVGVFELTQRQWELIMGKKPSFFSNTACYSTRPVECISYDDIRGATNQIPSVNWPTTGSIVSSNSLLGILRRKTGLMGFDLPTEAQWMYACRAGTTTMFNDGDAAANITGANAYTNAWLDQLGRYKFDGGVINGITYPSNTCTQINGTAMVGSYLPNALGLYDMHGNVWEWCLDWIGVFTAGTDPLGPVEGVSRTIKGGCWSTAASACTFGIRSSVQPNARSSSFGVRLVINTASTP